MKYALIIANSNYEDPHLSQLTAPGRDANTFAEVLKDTAIGAFDEVKIALNEPAHVAGRAIDEFFEDKKPDDLLLLYFSGHGIRDEAGALYLALRDTIRDRLRSTAIKSEFIREAMDQSRARRIVLILDCCNSGAFSHGTKAVAGASVGTASVFGSSGYGRVVLTASDSTQFAWEGDRIIGSETDNSLFTHFLIEGMKGEADLNSDGKITVDELYEYVHDEVVQRNPRQTPLKISPKQQGEIVLRHNLRPENIKPIALPEELTQTIDDTRPWVREGAVGELEKIVRGKNPGLARSAHEALRRMAEEDDSKRVAQAAAQILNSVQAMEQPAPRNAEGTKEAFGSPGTPPSTRIDSVPSVKKRGPIQIDKKTVAKIAVVLIACAIVVVLIIGRIRPDVSSYAMASGISNISTSTDAGVVTSSFAPGEDVYINFLVSGHRNSKFESKWYRLIDIFGSDVYFLIVRMEFVSDGHNSVYFYFNPRFRGYYKVDIYVDGQLAGSRNFWIK